MTLLSNNLFIDTISCPYHLTYTPTTATCTAAGKQGYYTCTICQRIYLNDDATGETTLNDLPAAGPLGHQLTHVDEVPATCTEDGNKEYWICTRKGCGKLFTDKDGKTETTLNDVRIPARHNLTFVPEVPSTCTEKGYEEHWVCTDCHKLFDDPKDTIETSLELLQLDLAPHKLTFVPEVPSTCTEKGYEAHWVCPDCHKLYDDPTDTTVETALELLQLDLAPHKLTFVPEKPATTTEEGRAAHYACTVCDGLFTDVAGQNETTPDALTLPVLVRTDDLPQTGDSSRLTGWLALLGACCAGLWRLNSKRA